MRHPINQLFEDMMQEHPLIQTSGGHRVETVDGETTHYFLNDGEWVEFAEHRNPFSVHSTNTATELTVETGDIEDLDVDEDDVEGVFASFNNDVLSVEFIHTTETDEGDES